LQGNILNRAYLLKIGIVLLKIGITLTVSPLKMNEILMIGNLEGIIERAIEAHTA
jgi:hypothetical protein